MFSPLQLFLLQIVVVTIHCKCLYGIYKIFFTSYYTIINNYFRLLTKYSNQWNVLTEGISFETATLHLKMISNMLIRNIQGQHHIENLKCTWNWHDFEFQTQISSNCGKRRDAYLIANFDIAWYIVEDEFEVRYCVCLKRSATGDTCINIISKQDNNNVLKWIIPFLKTLFYNLIWI